MDARSKQFCSRCNAAGLEQNVYFCIPTFQLDRSGDKQGSLEKYKSNDIGDTLMANTTLVYSLLRMSIQRPLLLPALPYLLLHLQGEKHSDCELKIAAWKITQKPGNGRNFKQCSQTGLHIQKTRFYSRLRIGGNKWVSWCCQQQIDRFCAPWSERLNYLSTLFEKDLQYRTINSHRYAISAYHGSQFISAYHDLQLTVVW